MRCGGPSTCFKRVLGTMLTVRALCDKCGCTRDWDSQPKVAGRPIFNVLLSGAILFTGSLPTNVLRMFQTLKIQCDVSRTFYRHQKNLLHDAMQKTWEKCQSALFESIKDRELVIGGDGRCDSKGKTAKFGCYVMMEMNMKKVLSTQLVQKNEVASSYHMELEGLKRSVSLFDGYNIKASITDRHSQIQKWLRENWAVTHLFDCWHVVKGLCKKLDELAKKKARRPIKDWIKSIRYHLYWCVMSSRFGDKEAIERKWLSCVDHIQNKHEGCSHGPLEKQKVWLREGTEACDKCVDLLTKP
ncbi:uncharacterized protein LOC135489052 isoform X2 [Lineus longissimus]|uniref:uncharacterized protein LOC135489052 isoform X2 n=1 Tax=Lineus longissimus TaxID=88925 RepID=UPI002B4D260B